MFKKPDWSFRAAKDRQKTIVTKPAEGYATHADYESDIQKRIKKLLGKTSVPKTTPVSKKNLALDLL